MPSEQGKKTVLHKKHVARLQRENQQSRIILFAFIGILIAVVALLVYGYLDIKYFQIQRPVAKIGNTKIIVKQFEARVRLQRQQLIDRYSQLSSQYDQYQQFSKTFGMDLTQQLQQISNQAQQIKSTLDTPETLGQSVLDQMIKEEIIRQEASKRGIKVDQPELQESIQSAFQYFPNGSPTPSVTPTQFTMPEAPAEAFTIVTKTPIPSPTPEITATPEPVTSTATSAADTSLTTGTPVAAATEAASATPTATVELTSTPEPTATPYTLAGYQSRYKDALDREMKIGFGDDFYNVIYENQLLEDKVKDVITANVARTQKQVWARHILVKDEALATSLIEKLKKGEDFATLAKENSTDTGSAVNGGDLGWFGSGAMVAEFETAAFALEKPGDFTLTPVKSQFGFHIIQLIAKQDRPLTAEQYDAAKTKAFTDWLTTARTEYGVVTYDVWKEHIPADPNDVTIATEAANAQSTAQAKELLATATPVPSSTP